MARRWVLALAVLLLVIPLVVAHETDDPHEEPSETLEARMTRTSLVIMGIAAGIVALLTTISILLESKLEPPGRWALFLGIAIPILAATLFSAGSTIYVNAQSETSGPVHWHADFEIWNCGTLVDLADPEGLLNRIGTSVFHEHGDQRIHIEGVVVDRGDVSLERFFSVIGGSLSLRSLTVPTTDGTVTLTDGTCPDGSEGRLQAFRYRTEDGRIVQEKLTFFTNYVPAGHSQVPPGDCVIIELGPEKETTEHLCASYRAALNRGALHGG